MLNFTCLNIHDPHSHENVSIANCSVGCLKKETGCKWERGVLKGVGAEWERKFSVNVKIHCMCIWISQRINKNNFKRIEMRKITIQWMPSMC